MTVLCIFSGVTNSMASTWRRYAFTPPFYVWVKELIGLTDHWSIERSALFDRVGRESELVGSNAGSRLDQLWQGWRDSGEHWPSQPCPPRAGTALFLCLQLLIAHVPAVLTGQRRPLLHTLIKRNWFTIQDTVPCVLPCDQGFYYITLLHTSSW